MRTKPVSLFTKQSVAYGYPEGFIMPLVYCLRAPMKHGDDGKLECGKKLWLTSEMKVQAVGFCYAVPEKLTDGTWNMLAIAVLPSQQGEGLGSAIVKEL